LEQAVHALLGRLRDGDRAALLTFSHTLQLDVPFTGDFATLQRGMERVASGGSTALRDALVAALVVGSASPRPVIVVFSDGEDNVSWTSDAEVAQAAALSDATVHAVVVEADAARRGGASGRRVELLKRICDATGGRLTVAA